MDSKTRLLAKAISWQLAGLVTMTAIGFIFTGSLSAGGGIAVTGAITGIFAYMLHELAWARIAWGQRGAPQPGRRDRRSVSSSTTRAR